MAVDSYADDVREGIASTYGDTLDLSEELVNTLANIQYFAVKSTKVNLGGLSDLKDIYPAKSESQLVKMYMAHIQHVALTVRRAPGLISRLREIRQKSAEMFEVFEQLTLDILKYRIDNAQNKTGIRRALERKTKSPCEHRGLARRFKIPFKAR